MPVGRRGNVIGNTAFAGLGVPVGRQSLLVQFRDDIAGLRNVQGVVDTGCSSRAIDRPVTFTTRPYFFATRVSSLRLTNWKVFIRYDVSSSKKKKMGAKRNTKAVIP
ncbi:MAG: hypothetical protein LUD46_20280 [Parabacteroides sp.]|nr:hypothetical protein [Parabacteroides sp.]